MIKYFCDRCGADVPGNQVIDTEQKTANAIITLYTDKRKGDESVQGLLGRKYKTEFILCRRCMNALSKWLEGERDEQPS